MQLSLLSNKMIYLYRKSKRMYKLLKQENAAGMMNTNFTYEKIAPGDDV